MYLRYASSFSKPRLARPARSDRRPHPAGAHQRVVLRWIDITESFVEFANVNVLRAIDGSGRGHAGGRLDAAGSRNHVRSEEHTSELQSLMRISYAVFCLKKTNILY